MRWNAKLLFLMAAVLLIAVSRGCKKQEEEPGAVLVEEK